MEDIETCPICMEPIERIYAMIENTGETGKYHTLCIEEWLKKSKNGILVQNEIESITIYDHDDKLCQLNIKFKEPEPFDDIYLFDNDDICHELCVVF